MSITPPLYSIVLPSESQPGLHFTTSALSAGERMANSTGSTRLSTTREFAVTTALYATNTGQAKSIKCLLYCQLTEDENLNELINGADSMKA